MARERLLQSLSPVWGLEVWRKGGGRPQSVRCETATFAPAAPAPRPSLRNQFSSAGLWPVACCIVPVFQSLPPWLGSGLWDQGFGFWA